MLPRGSYLDEAVLAWEREYFFGGWQCIGRASDIASGGMSAESVGVYGVLLTRDTEGVLRGFENACRHRGHELLPCGGSQQTKAIVCPYHAWTYRLDGSLVGAPGHRDVELDKQSLGLKPQARIVIYGEPVPAARLFFTLEYLAMSGRAAILDGGIAGWRAAGGS